MTNEQDATVTRATPAAWMTDLRDDIPLNGLTLPGSHDTCAYTVDDALARTQRASLAVQLARGVRVLDIRCRHEDDVFHINHQRIALGLMFDDVIATCAAFFVRHPGECIVMSVKDECGDRHCTRSFAQTFASYVEQYAAHVRWYLGDTIPRLGDVRGAIVLWRRFAHASTAIAPMGIDLTAWPDNATFDIERAGAGFTIQDEYRVPVEASIDFKWQRIDALLARTGALAAQRWVVNFCSGTGMGANPYRVAWGGGGPDQRGINDMLSARLTTFDGPCGTMMLDFCEHADWALVRELVARNARWCGGLADDRDVDDGDDGESPRSLEA
ncbi:phosphatidylinositol diacylglycerol-lyase [Pandoraea aquatica]|uniref:1-phosphatidylinositol phosphodiesterase n=1 Tax=Pandoraea aquatica TaxID=2508290 RepID=A0A5E4W478_9BURK|nr:phosphatidylinositol-specific phospholipase C [Pandoraea aquatica]VVE19211.1 phosphatidylinositol diacylglycerol-lyase [Pandoraea aquatica]